MDRIKKSMCLHGALRSIPFDMQHDYFQKKRMFSPFDLAPGAEGVYKDNICACVVLYTSFPLI